MGKLSQIERELISAYLDDALEGSELAQAEQLLKQNAEASTWLHELTRMRGQLKALSSSVRLESFAERVIAQAQVAAREQGLSPSHHVLRGDIKVQRKPAAVERDLSPARGGMWLVVGALAASILTLAVLPFGRPGPAPNTLAGIPPATATGPSAQAAPSESEPTAVDSPEMQAPSGERLVERDRRSPSEMHQPEKASALVMLNILDVELTADAWNAGKFDGLLAELGVVGAADFVCTKEVVQRFAETNLLGDPPGADEPDVAMVYLHGSASVFEQLYLSVQNDTESFRQPQYTLGEAGTDKLIQALQQNVNSAATPNYSRMIALDDPEQKLSQVIPKFEPLPVDDKTPKVDLSDVLNRDNAAHAVFGVTGDKLEGHSIIILRKSKS